MIGAAVVLTLLSSARCEEYPAALVALEAEGVGTQNAPTAALGMAERSAGQRILFPFEGDLSPEARKAAAVARLQGLCSEPPLSGGGTAEDADPAKLQEILDRTEFAQARQLNEAALARLMRKLEAWLQSLLGTTGAESFGQGGRAVFLGFALALLLALALRLWRAREGRREARSAALPAEALQLKPPETHLALARAALAADGREACRQGLLALLSALEQKRYARPDRVKTNRELSEELSTRGAPSELAAEVRRLLRWYDARFYSLEPVATEDALRFVDDVAQLRQQTLGGT